MSDIMREEYCLEVTMYHLFRLEYSMSTEGLIKNGIDDILCPPDREESCVISTLCECIIHELGAEVALDILSIYSEEEVIWFSDMFLYIFLEYAYLIMLMPIWTQYDDRIICSYELPERQVTHSVREGMNTSTLTEIGHRMRYYPIDKNP